MKLSEKQLHILQHSLGVDKHGRGNKYRNRYVIGPECDDWKELRALVDAGLMFDHGEMSMCGGMHCFSVTDLGKAEMEKNSPPPPKISRGRQRYLDFLNFDGGLTFIEYLKWSARLRKQRRI